MGSQELKLALKRLEKDWQELIASPLPNVSAAPLESNMLEWHCNILHNCNIYHLILFFPKEYPCVSPRLEIVPPGFGMEDVVVMEGEKGTKICLDIFSDFAHVHPEWRIHKNSGWSPSYTVQALLLNLLSFFHDKHQDEDTALKCYLEMSRSWVCSDCGHSQAQPFPPLGTDKHTEVSNHQSVNKDIPMEQQIAHVTPLDKGNNWVKIQEAKILDYVSREKFSADTVSSTDHLFGYGLILSMYEEDLCPTSPCEFVTANSFHDMCDTLGKGKSILRENLSFFLPLYITDDHGARIRPQFEMTMSRISRKFRFKFSLTNNYTHVTINVLCNLLSSIVNECFTSSRTSADSVFDGYFQIHRLFLWVVDTYPKVLKYVNKRLTGFLSNPSLQNRKSEFDFHYCFALLSVSTKHTWDSIAEVYLREHWRRCVQWYVIRDTNLSNMDMPVEDRLPKTFNLTFNDCARLAHHVAFLKMARPNGMSREQVLQRYADNLSFPAQESVAGLQNVLHRINNDIKSFNDWFRVIDVPVPSEEDLFRSLRDSVKYALNTRRYHRS